VNAFIQFVLGHGQRVGMPVLTYPGAVLVGRTVRDLVTHPQVQAEVQAALHQRHPSPFALSAMDLSAESEAFGSEVLLTDTEVPTVINRLVTTREAADALRMPEPGACRTGVYLETVRRLRNLPGKRFVFAGMIGPFSLAARLYGVSEALSLTVEDPELMQVLVRKSAQFLQAYALAFKAAGADGVIVAEPTAGLLSPRSLAEYSSAHVKKIVAAVDDEKFSLMLHNCAAKLVHLPSILASGAKVFHFGAPMDLPAALKQVPPEIVLCGNLDPAKVFVNSSAAEVTAAARALLEATRAHSNFVLSSGCDVPPGTPAANIDAFYAALAS
jgi:uroporphyrinogen decarboxylase